MDPKSLKTSILSGGIDTGLLDCGRKSGLPDARTRCAGAVDAFATLFGSGRAVSLYSVGGRTEIGGNHTDHNHGQVIAASVDLDILAVAAPRSDGRITIHSEGFAPDTAEPSMLEEADPAAYFTSRAMIAGVARGFLDRGYAVGGLDAYTTSAIPKGAGLSSSAAFGVMVGNMLNHLYNGGRIDSTELARIAQFAENTFFGKPCGLMDQLACATGGIVHMDFADPACPKIKGLSGGPAAGYTMCIVNTGASHADLGEEYAAIPREMGQVAALFGQPVLRGLSLQALLARAGEIRRTCGDRALLRAIHFIEENRRVDAQARALAAGETEQFLRLVLESGRSSLCYLQNGYAAKNPAEQGVPLALCLTEAFFAGEQAAWRLHGGGFGGTIQVFAPAARTEDYKRYIETFFGAGACHVVSIRRAGAVCLWKGEDLHA